MRADQPAAHDLGLDLLGHGIDPQLDRAIGKEDSVARTEVGGEALLAHAGAGGVAGGLAARSKREAGTGLQRELVVRELAEPDLRPREVGEERDRTPGALCGGMHRSRRVRPAHPECRARS